MQEILIRMLLCLLVTAYSPLGSTDSPLMKDEQVVSSTSEIVVTNVYSS